MLRAAISLVIAGTSAAAVAQQPATPFIPAGTATEAPRGFVEMCREDHSFCAASPAMGDGGMVTAAILPSRGADRPDEATIALAGGSRDRASWSIPRWRPAGPWAAPTILSGLATPVAPVTIAAERIAAPAAEIVVTAPSGADELLRRVNRFVNGRVAQRTDMRVYGRDEYWHRSGVGRGAAGDCEDIAIEKRFELLAAGFPADKLAFAVVYLPRIGLHAVLVARTGEGDMVLDSRTPYVERWDRTAYSWVSIQSMDAPMAWHNAAPAPARVQYVAAEAAAGRVG